ncbi:uncharacterized protein LOC120631777 [Pararge aegeria]|uniref:uncharacterized protein LOC120631777 n=1 Tax=Pararge aegeria TaxID=116150 RepID=UPI0019D2B902|nr:uncharacterized protein LOC120631777 [Pararge aegeria]
MTLTVKCSNCNIVIDELLAYIQNKISIADEPSLVKICESAFSFEQIEKAKNLLLDSLPKDLRTKVRKGKGKENRILLDIISVFKVNDPDLLPIFVARDLEKLPPVTFDHLDVSKLLKDLMIVQSEIKNIKSSYATVEQLEDLKRDYLNEKPTSPPFSAVKINMKRGAYRDSGPIGLSQLDDTIVTASLNESNSNVLSPTEGDIRYRSIDLNKVGGSHAECSERCVTSGGHSADGCAATGAERRESSRMLSNASDGLTVTEKNKSYAGVVRVQNPNDGWTVVQRKVSKSKNRLLGKRGNVVIDSEEKFRAADRKIPLFITNVDKNTTESDIVKYIKSKTKEDVV